MQLILIGGRHDSLKCQKQLVSIFRELVKSHPSPEFVAVEHNEEVFKTTLLVQRSIQSLPDTKLKFLSKTLTIPEMDQVAKCIAYEADSHIPFYPKTMTLWLDDKRELSERDIKAAGSLLYNKLAFVAEFKRTSDLDFTKLDLIEEYTKIELDEPSTPKPNPARDSMWVESLIPHLSEDIDKYAFIIVGNDHTQERGGHLRPLLRGLHHGITIRRTC